MDYYYYESSSSSGGGDSGSGHGADAGGGESKYGVAGEATFWSSITSIGFLLPALVFSALFILFEKKSRRQREVGGFAVFMIMLELIDAIPEAAVIAQSTVNRNIGWSFVISIMSLNIVNTSASAIDFLATSNNKKLHQLLFGLLFFSVGMLVYSISADVYAKFAELFKSDERNVYHMISLLLGTGLGFTLIILLMKLEHKLAHKNEESKESVKEDDTLIDVLKFIHDQLMIITPKIQKYLSAIQTFPWCSWKEG